MEAFHDHDCDRCIRLLSTEYGKWKIDVHYCGSSEALGGSLILRLSSNPSDYWSSALDTLHSTSRSLAYWSPVMQEIVKQAGCATPNMRCDFNVWANAGSWPQSQRERGSTEAEDNKQITLLRCSILGLALQRRPKKEG